MPAKKNIIKNLRQEIKALEDAIKEQHKTFNHHKRMYAREKDNHEYALARINVQTNNIASGLKHRFMKELTWLALCDDPDSKMQIVKGAIDELHLIAKPRDKNNEF